MRTVAGVTPPGDRHRIDEAAAIVAGWPGVWTRLLAEHVTGPDGRCTACPRGTRGSPHWPCSLAGLALRARRLHNAEDV